MNSLQVKARELSEAQKLVAALNEELSKAVSVEEKKRSPRERSNMLKVIYTVARRRYRYDPTKRTDAVTQIIGDLEELGLRLSSDTVGSYLKEGAALYPDWREDQKQ